VSSVSGKKVTTIEGLASTDGKLHPVQQAWIEEDVPQCGYCQGGQIMAAVDLLKQIPSPSDADIGREMRNICRCGTYSRIRKAIHRASVLMAKER
jgi:isoquinoline 1-oxidoreductase alpha subunit